MAMKVVDLLEIIQIVEQSRNAGTISARTTDLVEQKLSEVTRIVKFGEIICLGESFCLGNSNSIRHCGGDGERQRIEKSNFRLGEYFRLIPVTNSFKYSKKSPHTV